MALDATRLGNLIGDKINEGLELGLSGDNLTSLKATMKEVADAIISEFTDNAVVSTSVPGEGLVAPVGGGPVTGTASGSGGIS